MKMKGQHTIVNNFKINWRKSTKIGKIETNNI